MGLPNEYMWLSTSQAARCLGIEGRQLYQVLDAGELPASVFGQQLRISEADVREFLRRRDEGDGPEGAQPVPI